MLHLFTLSLPFSLHIHIRLRLPLFLSPFLFISIFVFVYLSISLQLYCMFPIGKSFVATTARNLQHKYTNNLTTPIMLSADITLEYTLPLMSEPISLEFGQLDHYSNETLVRAVVHGISIGLCTILATVLLIVPTARRKSPVFVLNMLLLVLLAVRLALNLGYLAGALNLLSFAFTGIVSGEQIRAFPLVVATGALQVLLIALVELSMVYQVYTVVLAQGTKRVGHIVSGVAAVLAAVLVGFYIGAVACDTNTSRAVLGESRTQTQSPAWLKNVPNILFCVLVNYFNLVLVVKLALAIRTRRYLGLKQFDAFHVLVVMCVQSMVVPSVLAIVNYSTNYFKNPAVSFAHVLLIVLSLPVSSIWAAAANDSQRIPSVFAAIRKVSSGSSHDSDASTLHGNSLMPQKVTTSELFGSSWLPLALDLEKIAGNVVVRIAGDSEI